MNYNQKRKQKEFTDYYTQLDWESDCSACAAETHNVNEPIPHDCYMCAEFSPVVDTYSFFNFFYLFLWIGGGIFLIYKIAKRRK